MIVTRATIERAATVAGVDLLIVLIFILLSCCVHLLLDLR